MKQSPKMKKEKEYVEKELSKLLESTLRLEDELNSIVNYK
jgi:hypothetical protein